MPINYSAWGAPATLGEAFLKAYQEAQAHKMQQNIKEDQAAAARGLLADRMASIPGVTQQGLQGAVERIMPAQQNKFPAFNPLGDLISSFGGGNVEPKPEPMPLPKSEPQDQILGPGISGKPLEQEQLESSNIAPQGGNLPPVSGFMSTSKVFEPGQPSLKQQADLSEKMALEDQRQGHRKELVKNPASSASYASTRGYAMLDKVVADPIAKRRLSSVEPALQTHNAIVDLYNAYHSGDEKTARGLADTLYTQIASAASRHESFSPYFQSNMPSINNIPAIYEAARRLAAAEQNKLVSGSQAAPSDVARVEFAANYPTLSDQAQTAQGKFDRITHTLIMPAITGLKRIVSPYKNWKSNPQIPLIAQDYENMLNYLEKEVTSRVKNVQGYNAGTEQNVMPQPSQSTGPKVLAVREKGQP